MLNSKEQTIERMKELIAELNNYRESYYNHNISIISDYEYDKLFDELKEIENTLNIYYPNSPTQQVGYTVVSNLEKVKHEYPLLSLDKTKTINDIIKFAEGNDLCYSAKMDGLTICLTYDNGYLVKAETRGDGFEGELVTHNVSTFSNVPLSISYKEHLVVVGEAILRKNQLNIINAELPEDKRYKHVRNLVSGTVRQLDSKICAKRNPMFIAWDCLTDIAPTLNDKLIKLNTLGFAIVPRLTYSVNQPNIYNETIHNILSAGIDTIKDICNSFDYPIDGIVFTLNNINIGKSKGQTEHHFKNAIAYKFYDEETVTHLRDIEWSMGRTGVLTPVAIFDTVDIDGTDVSRASLHNVSILKDLKLGIDDEITVYKANQIIPQINENLTKSNTYEIPTACPYCHSVVKQITDNDSTILKCTNNSCWERKLGEFTHFVSKPCMNIVGLSEQSIKLFLEKGWINDPIDLYTLTLRYHYEDIVNTEGWSNVSADKLFKAINDSRNVKLENAINALGIDGIGIKASKDIAKYCNYDWHNFTNPKYYEHFDKINGFGEVMCKSVIDKLRYDYMYINDLFSEFNFIDAVSETNNVLEGKTFVITGSLNHYKNRDELVSVIESNGGKVSGSISAKTNYLINNDITSNSGKNKKAKELNIPIITEEDFRTMIAVIGVDLADNEDFVKETLIPVKDLETRGMTEHERKVYDDMLKNGTVKTGRKLF
jgi:DNA ligase (NAD+)